MHPPLPRLLVVDDEPAMRDVLELVLSQEFVVATAGNGLEALDHLATNDVDAVVLDVMMPVMDGLETARRLRADEATQHLPIVMFTALAGGEAERRGREAGADAYLVKTLGLDLLASTVKLVLAERSLARRTV